MLLLFTELFTHIPSTWTVETLRYSEKWLLIHQIILRYISNHRNVATNLHERLKSHKLSRVELGYNVMKGTE
jgi:hypothetical protein